jgi:hypothetical protein
MNVRCTERVVGDELAPTWDRILYIDSFLRATRFAVAR